MNKTKYSLLPQIPAYGSFHAWLLLSAAFSCFLLVIRLVVTGTTAFIFLPWNLFLAFVPYCITWWIATNPAIMQSKWKLIIALGSWLLFIPNSFYIITDLFHLTHVNSAPKWFDLLLIFSFAWNGLLCGVISLRRVEVIVTWWRGKTCSVPMVAGVMWLNALGIYIGRFLRFNSWDVLADPFSLAGEIADLAFHPLRNGYAWGMTVCYAAFMTLVYYTMQKFSESR